MCLILGFFFCLCVFFSDIEREEKSVQKAIKDAAKRNDMGSAKVLCFFLLKPFCSEQGFYLQFRNFMHCLSLIGFIF